MPKAKTETRPHSERSKGLSRTSPGNSVQASSTASHSLVSTRVQANGSGAVLSPSSVAISQAFSSQVMPFKSVLPPHFLETLVAKVADEVSHRFSTVPLLLHPLSWQRWLSACSSSSTSMSTFGSPSTSGPDPTSSPASPEGVASSVVQQCGQHSKLIDRCSSASTIRDARSVIPVCRVAGRCLCIWKIMSKDLDQ